MNAGPQGGRRIALLLRPFTKDPSICRSCRNAITQRRNASTAAAVAETPTPASQIPPTTQASSPKPAYQINASVVLSRPPQITRDLTTFEKAYFFYQRRLNERLALPFTRYFYFKKGTPADLEWKRKIKQRQTAARDIGAYNAYSKEGWNDELLVGAGESEPEKQVQALLRDAEFSGVGSDETGEATKESVERPMPRITEADTAGDVKSLNRLLQRTLYLLVKVGEGTWGFPTAGLVGKENLHQAAERILVQAGGVNMNTWVVGNVPIGHRNHRLPKAILESENSPEQLEEKTFFMKARIMAGQANMTDNKLGLADFKWLAKDEIEKTVTPGYWSAVRNMLAEL
ncbi:MAG: 54S ribosomal protein L17 mitochondrial [Pleopsidium flavum]|nr:MAG: 54S ribosomal protein L17 mitochondrial [Pleopsidium flavum]